MNATARPSTLYSDRKALNSWAVPFGAGGAGGFWSSSVILRSSARISSFESKGRSL